MVPRTEAPGNADDCLSVDLGVWGCGRRGSGSFDRRHPGWELYEPAMEAARNIDPRRRDALQYLEEAYVAATKGAPAVIPAEPESDFARAWRLAARGIKVG
jgi:hypothetical protein